MIVKTRNNLIYDSSDDRCDFISVASNGNEAVGFVFCYDERTQHKDRYCAIYNVNDDQAKSIEDIMSVGVSFDKQVNVLHELINTL